MKTIKHIIIILLFALVLQGCSTANKNNTLSIKMPPAMYMNGKVYWEVSERNVDQHILTEVGTVEYVAEEQTLLYKDFMVNTSAKQYKGCKVFEEAGIYYILYKDQYTPFAYITKTKNNGRQSYEESNKQQELLNEEIPSPGLPAPHFIYQDITYFQITDRPTEED